MPSRIGDSIAKASSLLLRQARQSLRLGSILLIKFTVLDVIDFVLGETGENEQSIDLDVGSDIRINRLGFFSLWKKTKSDGSDFLRHRINGISLFDFEHNYACPVRIVIGSIAFSY